MTELNILGGILSTDENNLAKYYKNLLNKFYEMRLVIVTKIENPFLTIFTHFMVKKTEKRQSKMA